MKRADNHREIAVKKGDILLIVCLLLLSLLLFARSFSTAASLEAEIYLAGEKVQTLSLSSLSESETVSVGGCELLLEKDGVTFLHSDCRDLLCVKRGKLSKQGDTMACVPNKVVVVLRACGGEENEIHGVAY